jgi:hypothetical protein
MTTQVTCEMGVMDCKLWFQMIVLCLLDFLFHTSFALGISGGIKKKGYSNSSIFY